MIAVEAEITRGEFETRFRSIPIFAVVFQRGESVRIQPQAVREVSLTEAKIGDEEVLSMDLSRRVHAFVSRARVRVQGESGLELTTQGIDVGLVVLCTGGDHLAHGTKGFGDLLRTVEMVQRGVIL